MRGAVVEQLTDLGLEQEAVHRWERAAAVVHWDGVGFGLAGAGFVGAGFAGAGLVGVGLAGPGLAGAGFARVVSPPCRSESVAAVVSRGGGSGITSVPTTSPETPVTFRTPRISTV